MDPSLAPNTAGSAGGLAAPAAAQPGSPVSADYEVSLVSLNQWQLAWRRFRRHKLAMIGSAMFIGMCLVGAIGPFLVHYDPLSIPTFVKGCGSGCGPNFTHPFGTTGGLQRDVFAITVNGARLSLLIGVGASLFSTVIGTVVGGVAGYFGGWVDNLLMRVVDVLLSLPLLFVIIVVAKFLGAGNWFMIMLVFAIFGWAGLARLVRSLFLTLREEVFVEAARAVGVSDLRIIFRHILPNAVSPIIVATTLSVAGVIITEAFVSYLGYGVDPNTPTWGNALQSAQNTLPNGNWWHPFFPGMAIVLTVVGINFMGDGLRDALDPRSRE